MNNVRDGANFVHQDDDPLCRSFFFSLTASLMSRSQTDVWASYSRPFLQPRTCTSIRITVLRLKTRELACGNFTLTWTTTTTTLLTSSLLPCSPFYLSVVGSREFESRNLCNPILHGLGKSYRPFAIIMNRGTRPDLSYMRTWFGLNLDASDLVNTVNSGIGNCTSRARPRGRK